MPQSNTRPIFPVVLTEKTAIKYIRELTRWVGPGFHPDENFHNYVNGTGEKSFAPELAHELNSELDAATSKLEFHGIDPCDVGFPEQKKMILQMMYNIDAEKLRYKREQLSLKTF